MPRQHITNPDVVKELKDIQSNTGGLLHPRDVVEAARAVDSPLHSFFEWDTDTAAEAWRIQQARNLINAVYVTVEAGGKKRQEQVFVSLSSDREKGGYRALVDVLSHAESRNQLVRDALSDMQSFTTRYNTLRELARVRSEMKQASKRLTKIH